MNDEDLRNYIQRARAKAAPVGPMHAMWDVIFDAEALPEKKKSIMSRKDVERELKAFVEG